MDLGIKLRVKVDVEKLIEILFALCDRFELFLRPTKWDSDIR